MKFSLPLSMTVCAALLCSFASGDAKRQQLSFGFDAVRSTPTEKNVEGETVEVVHETASGPAVAMHVIGGYHDLVDGVRGKALLFDGYTTRISVSAKQSPTISDGLTASAWVALGAYPWNWTPIAAQEETVSKNEQRKDTCWPQTLVPGAKQAGWYFGIGPRGQLALMFAVEGKWHQCVSDDFVFPLHRWTHAAATYDKKKGATLYVDGEKVATHDVTGPISRTEVDLVIGMNRELRKQSHPVRPFATLPAWFALDGMIDELTVLNTVDAGAITQASQAQPSEPAFEPRVMPSGPDGDVPFGAYYHRLKYYKQWDRLWRVGDDPDVVVRFENSPTKVVFWRGTRYGPAWVTENGLWMGDQSIENFNGKEGCIEHMLDPHCRFSHVRIIESTPARAVVHWRYCPVAANGAHSQVDPKTGWSDWVDEYYYFYPDEVGMRHVVLRTRGRFLWPEEVIGLCHPGQRPEDVVDLSALELVNLKGQSHTYTWAEKSPKIRAKTGKMNYLFFGGDPEDPEDKTYEDADEDQPVIVMVNTKSRLKPFQVVEPDSWMAIFGIEHRPGVSHFPWWNHWPVSQLPSDGRYAQAPDRAAHFSLAWASPLEHKGDGETFWWAWMYGMSDKGARAQIPLAASWLHAPKMTVEGDGFSGGDYSFQTRCYRVACEKAKADSQLEMTLAATKQSPVHNVPILIENWGRRDVRIQLNGKLLEAGDCEIGYRTRLDKTDLVLFIRAETTEPAKVTVSP
jgi:hypothetical protein